jgi:ketosteroid isomerase-like protein
MVPIQSCAVGGLFTGHAGLDEFLAKRTATIRSKVTTERYIADEDHHVAAIGRTRGHVVATGREFDVPETHV